MYCHPWGSGGGGGTICVCSSVTHTCARAHTHAPKCLIQGRWCTVLVWLPSLAQGCRGHEAGAPSLDVQGPRAGAPEGGLAGLAPLSRCATAHTGCSRPHGRRVIRASLAFPGLGGCNGGSQRPPAHSRAPLAAPRGSRGSRGFLALRRRQQHLSWFPHSGLSGISADFSSMCT